MRLCLLGTESLEDTTDDVYDPSNPTEMVISSGSLITEEIASQIDALGITRTA